ncbi:hypothetical protein Cni_G14433 [Canna indica]|uniref:DUF4378 domain-containing protein n=1 Tax=Canna indica TaxID=4628 RepID=A0AAQ3KCX8_9LILI|nr:hypothetical protein Cni_G14433 [Canna indica]
MAQKPLLLKDYLELDWNVEPCGAGFHCVPRRADEPAATIRCLLEEELRGGIGGWKRKLPRKRSMRALTKISTVLNAVKLLPFAATASSSESHRSWPEGLSSRSFSMRLRGRFWGKKGKEEEEKENRVRAKDMAPRKSFEEEKTIDERRPLDVPPSVLSSCSSRSKSASVSDVLPSSATSSDIFIDISVAATAGDIKKDSPWATPDHRPGGPSNVGEDAEASAAVDRREESPECHSSSEENEQLSPVSVMDFPSEEEEEEEEDGDDDDTDEATSSPSFDRSLAKLERTKVQLLQKIRRFECLADLDLSESDADGGEEDEEETDEGALQGRTAWGLLGELKATSHVGVNGICEKLLIDFFDHELSCSDGAQLLDTARVWMEGRGCGDLCDYDGEATMREMERDGRWRSRFEAEEEEVGAKVELLLLGSLMEEMVAEFVQ